MLARNKITSVGMIEFAKNGKNFKKLKTVYLYINNITD
jgi:hypothetical protein